MDSLKIPRIHDEFYSFYSIHRIISSSISHHKAQNYLNSMKKIEMNLIWMTKKWWRKRARMVGGSQSIIESLKISSSLPSCAVFLISFECICRWFWMSRWDARMIWWGRRREIEVFEWSSGSSSTSWGWWWESIKFCDVVVLLSFSGHEAHHSTTVIKSNFLLLFFILH